MTRKEIITESLEDIVFRLQEQRKTDSNLHNLQAFCREMERLGLVKKQEYNLPLLDTVGRYAFFDQTES